MLAVWGNVLPVGCFGGYVCEEVYWFFFNQLCLIQIGKVHFFYSRNALWECYWATDKHVVHFVSKLENKNPMFWSGWIMFYNLVLFSFLSVSFLFFIQLFTINSCKFHEPFAWFGISVFFVSMSEHSVILNCKKWKNISQSIINSKIYTTSVLHQLY